MKVLFYRQFIGQDGIATWMLTLASQLRRLGVDCAFWFPKIFYTPIADFEQLGLVFTAPPHEAANDLQSANYDIIHVVNSDFTAELLGLIRPSARIVVTSHGDLADAWDSGNSFAYTAVSEDMAVMNQSMTDLVVETVPNGIDCERFTPSTQNVEPRPVVAWVGRSTDSRKDFARFTRIAEKLVTQGTRIWVADAHGASWDDLKDLGCCRVPFERWERVSVADMPQFYQDLAAIGGLLLMTSRHEGWGLAAVEAAACGVPTLAPNVVGLRKAIVPGVTGELFPQDSSDEVVAGLASRLLQRLPETWNKQACIAEAKRTFSADAMVRRYLEIYNRAQQRKGEVRINSPQPGSECPDGMIKRLQSLKWHRAAFLSDAARQLARTGYAKLAWRALRRSVAIAPRSAFHPARTCHLLTTAAINLKNLFRRRITTEIPRPLDIELGKFGTELSDNQPLDGRLSALHK